jgi:glycine/D-amino acid oxidase-like deaminating enzyme
VSPDIIIVGAGVAGASAAFHLSRLGAGDVLVLDRGTVGAGMSSRSSALVRMHYTYQGEVELAVRSDRMFAQWPELTGRPPVVRRTGFARIVLPGEESALAANVRMQRSCGAQAELIDAAAFAGLAPGIRTDDLSQVAWEPAGGYGDGAIVAGDLLGAARERGVRYQPNTPVSALQTTGGRVTGVITGDGPLSAGTVLLAAGVWAPPLLRGAGVDLPIETELHHVALLSHPAGGGAPIACIDSTTQTYFRPEAGGRMTLVGSFTGPRGADPDQVLAAPDPVTAHPADLAELVGAAAGRLPALADAGIARGVTGAYDMTPDCRPLLGEVPGLAGLVLAAGFSGTGFKISPAVGEAIAELITSGKANHVDIEPFRPGRFAEGRPIRATFPYDGDL